MRVQDKPRKMEQPYLMRVQDKPGGCNIEQPYLMRVHDKSRKVEQPYLMRVQDKPRKMEQPYLMRVQDKPTQADDSWLMTVRDKAISAISSEADIMFCGAGFPFNLTGLPTLGKYSEEDESIYKHAKHCQKSPSLVVNDDSEGTMESEPISWIPLLKDEQSKEKQGYSDPEVNISAALNELQYSSKFLRIFWPFDYAVNENHQKLAAYVLGEDNRAKVTKASFYESLEKIQQLEIPVKEDEIVLSFKDDEVVEALERVGLLVNPKEFIIAGHHLFSEAEEKEIRQKTKMALKLIYETDKKLYESLIRVVACIGFYKASNVGHLGGTVSSAIGLIWLDPSKGGNWDTSFMAEQIVHEYIHLTLFTVDLVRGIFSDVRLLPKSLVKSSIRNELRDYDKSFHAAYVSAGLVAFHSRAGNVERATELTITLRQSVQDLADVNKKTGVLSETGTGLLQHLSVFLDKAYVI